MWMEKGMTLGKVVREKLRIHCSQALEMKTDLPLVLDLPMLNFVVFV